MRRKAWFCEGRKWPDVPIFRNLFQPLTKWRFARRYLVFRAVGKRGGSVAGSVYGKCVSTAVHRRKRVDIYALTVRALPLIQRLAGAAMCSRFGRAASRLAEAAGFCCAVAALRESLSPEEAFVALSRVAALPRCRVAALPRYARQVSAEGAYGTRSVTQKSSLACSAGGWNYSVAFVAQGWVLLRRGGRAKGGQRRSARGAGARSAAARSLPRGRRGGAASPGATAHRLCRSARCRCGRRSGAGKVRRILVPRTCAVNLGKRRARLRRPASRSMFGGHSAARAARLHLRVIAILPAPVTASRRSPPMMLRFL